MAARKVFTDKELEQMVKDVNEPKATKAAVARKWGIAATTLNKRIEEFTEKQTRADERKQTKKHTRITESEKEQIINLYVKDAWSMNAIAKLLQRSAGAVKRVLESANIPVRGRGKKSVTPTEDVGDTENPLSVGSRVFSYKYNSYATVTKLIGVDGDTFRIWVDGDYSFSAYQPRDRLALIPE